MLLYHGTSSHRGGNIIRVGLTAPGGYNELRYMLTTSFDAASAFARYSALRETRKGARPVVVEVDLPDDVAGEYLYLPGQHTRAGTVIAPALWAERPGYGDSPTHQVYAMRKPIPPEYIRSVQQVPLERAEIMRRPRGAEVRVRGHRRRA